MKKLDKTLHPPQYGLVGYPIGHSFSPAYFNGFFQREGLPFSYARFELEHISELPQLLEEVPELVGLNVTLPYKQAVLDYVHELSPEVQALGASNVLKISRSASGQPYLKAYNTDIVGFRSSLLELLGDERPQALLFGTGGAAAAVGYVLRELGISFRQVSRSPERAELTYTTLEEALRPEELLWINATSVGLQTGECLPLPYERLSSAHYAYDLIYNPSQTTFLEQAASQEARTMNGLKMLYRQADEAWRIWTTDAL